MPSWLTAYPVANEQTRQLGPLVESSYTAAAPPRDVLSISDSSSQPLLCRSNPAQPVTGL